jgi:hypothetical protein
MTAAGVPAGSLPQRSGSAPDFLGALQRARDAFRRGDPLPSFAELLRWAAPSEFVAPSGCGVAIARHLAEVDLQSSEQVEAMGIEAALEVLSASALTLQDLADGLAESRQGGERLELGMAEHMSGLSLHMLGLCRALERCAQKDRHEAS